MSPIPLFVEICAGTAAVSLRLHRRGARPPVSRMGSKAGYADTILGALGLSPGQGAERYLWAEADPGVRLLLAAYTDRRLAQGAAEIIRGWAGEEPRALWERLRAEGPFKGAPGADAREVARWLQLVGASLYGKADHFAGWGRYLGEDAQAYLGEATCRRYAERYGTAPDGRPMAPGAGHPDVMAPRLEGLPEMPGRVVDSAGVDPYEVARWLRIVSANRLINVGCDWKNTGAGGSTFGGTEFCTEIADLLRAVEGVEEMPGAVVERANFEPPRLPAGSVVMIDPPYSDVAPMVPPVLVAERLGLGRVGRAEGDAALFAAGLEGLREPVAHFRVAVAEVLRAVGVEAQVLDSVVERVVVDVVDDLVWSQFASKVALHDQSVLRNAPSVLHDEAVPVLNPPLALVAAPVGGHLLPLRGHLRDFAVRCQSVAGLAAEFSKALAWADCALSARRGVPWPLSGGAANLARDIEHACTVRVRVRQDTNTKTRIEGRKTTGYAHDLPRAEVVRIARAWRDAGARVAVCEAEPIGELVEEGWAFIDYADQRVGQKRTFSKQQREVLTMSEPPAPGWRTATQTSLFGGGP